MVPSAPHRAQDKAGTSRLGYANSTDGVHFTRRSEPVLVPETDYEREGSVEDPRQVKIGSTYYLTYTGYNKKDAQLCLAASKDLIDWERQGIIMPAYRGAGTLDGLNQARLMKVIKLCQRPSNKGFDRSRRSEFLNVSAVLHGGPVNLGR
jgi:predicted GH43/DUF377 family glycosyl hydrolase